MKMNRRNALLGLGAIATGGGALFGSGAFSQVTAERSVSIGVSGDSSALLVLKQGTGATGIVGTENSQNDGSGTQVSNITFSAGSLNADAKTTWNKALEIENGGQDQINLKIQTGGGLGTELDFQDQTGTSIVGNTITIDANNAETVAIDIIVNLTSNNDVSDIPSLVTFEANAV